MRPEPPDVGDVAPEVDLPAHDGSRFRLSEQRGRPVVLISTVTSTDSHVRNMRLPCAAAWRSSGTPGSR